MRKKFNGVLINFRVTKNKTNDNYVILLHGFGGSTDSFKGLEDYLITKNLSVINLDFAGFGKSGYPLENYDLNDYFIIVKQLLNYLNIDSVSVVAHSFGGRVAILLSTQTDMVRNLILVDSAGIKPRFSFFRWLKIKIYKTKKMLNNKCGCKFNLEKYGSSDYKSMPKNLRVVFNKIVNCDLTNLLKDITAKTLLIWGEKDTSTPLYMAKKFKKYINGSELYVYKDSSHFSYLENHNDFCKRVGQFLEKEN